MKRLFKFLALVLLALIIALIFVPIFFKSELIDAVKTEINKNINAEVDFADADVSLFKAFPKISIALNDFKVDGVGTFEGKQLMTAENINVSTDIKSLFKSSEGITIYDITLDKPFLNIIVEKNGEANYDITKKSESTSEDSFFGNIESYTVNEGDLNYSDYTSNTFMHLENVDHTGKGNFKDINFDLETVTDIESVSYRMDGINYLKDAKAHADLDLGINLDNKTYTFKENKMSINDLALSFTGIIKLLEEGFDLDLKFNAPNNKVSSLLSFVPQIYTQDYKNIRSEGTGNIVGAVKGVYNGAKEMYPAIDIKLDIANGVLQYPDLPMPIKDILVDMTIKSQNPSLSDLAVNIPGFKFKLDEDVMEGNLAITNALANANIKGGLKGKLDLQKLAKAYPLEDVDLKSGVIDSDITIDTDKESILNKDYKNVKFSGAFNGNDIAIVSEGKNINVESFESTLNPKAIDAKVSNAQIGNSDFKGSVRVEDPLLTLLDEGQSTAIIKMKSDVLDIDELMTFSETEENAIDTIATDIPMQTMAIDASYDAKTVKYEDYDVKNVASRFAYANDKLDLISSSALLDGKPLSMKGTLDKPMAFVFNDETVTGKVYLTAKEINANKYINESNETAAVEEVIAVPKSMDIELFPEIETLIYDTYTLKNTNGKITIADGIAALQNGKTRVFNGVVDFEGAYNSTDIDNPLFDFKYDMSDVNFTEMFEKSKSFRLMAPIAKYIDGIFNSNLIISGPLGKDMLPDLTKVTASGFMETVKGQILGFEPLEKVGEALGINAIKDWEIKDSKNWFDMKDGRVILKDHDYKFDEMLFTVGGNHGIDQTIDYKIKAVIPRDRLKDADVGKTLEMGMSRIEKEATSRGVDISLGENIFLDIFLTGSVLKPKVKIIPVGSGGKTLKEVVKDEIVKQVDVLKDTVQEELEKRTEVLKDTVTTVIESQVDTIKTQVEEKVDEKKEELKDKLKKEVEERIDSTVAGTVVDTLQNQLEDKVGDVLGDKGKEEIDSLKSKLEGWNPFKKKKKN